MNREHIEKNHGKIDILKDDDGKILGAMEDPAKLADKLGKLDGVEFPLELKSLVHDCEKLKGRIGLKNSMISRLRDKHGPAIDMVIENKIKDLDKEIQDLQRGQAEAIGKLMHMGAILSAHLYLVQGWGTITLGPQQAPFSLSEEEAPIYHELVKKYMVKEQPFPVRITALVETRKALKSIMKE